MTERCQRRGFAAKRNGAKDSRGQERVMLCIVKDIARLSRIVGADDFDSARDVGNDGFIEHDRTPLRDGAHSLNHH